MHAENNFVCETSTCVLSIRFENRGYCLLSLAFIFFPSHNINLCCCSTISTVGKLNFLFTRCLLAQKALAKHSIYYAIHSVHTYNIFYINYEGGKHFQIGKTCNTKVDILS